MFTWPILALALVSQPLGGLGAARRSVDGQQPPAGQLPALPVTQIDDRPRAADLDAPRRVSVSFAEPVPLRDVLLLLVRDTPFSLALDPEATGTFIGELKEVTLRQAFDAVLAPRGLHYDVQGTLIRVFVRRAETRLFDLNVLNVHRGWQRTVSSADGTTLAASAGNPDPLDDIERGIESLLSSSGRAHVDRRSGVVQVTDDVERLDRVGLYLEALQIRASRQVRLEGRVLEVRLKDRESIDWRAVRQRLGLAPASAAAGIAGDLGSIQDALAAQGEVRVIATPDVVAMNNEPAMLRTGTPDVSWLTLTVIPQISSDGIVQLSVSPSWSERAGTRQEDGHAVAAMRVSEADTVARVADGHTVLLAGILGTAEGTKPAGGIGALFGAPARQLLHTELVVLLTPTVITPAPIAAGAR